MTQYAYYDKRRKRWIRIRNMTRQGVAIRKYIEQYNTYRRMKADPS